MWHVACRGGRTDRHARVWWGKPEETGHLEDLDLDGRVILKGPYVNMMVGHELN